MEMCIGVVKVPELHQKNPLQHAADLNMLHTIPELQSVLFLLIQRQTHPRKENA